MSVLLICLNLHNLFGLLVIVLLEGNEARLTIRSIIPCDPVVSLLGTAAQFSPLVCRTQAAWCTVKDTINTSRLMERPPDGEADCSSTNIQVAVDMH